MNAVKSLSWFPVVWLFESPEEAAMDVLALRLLIASANLFKVSFSSAMFKSGVTNIASS